MHHLRCADIQTPHRLAGHQYARLPAQFTGQNDFLPVAAGQGANRLVERLQANAEPPDLFCDIIAAGGPRQNAPTTKLRQPQLTKQQIFPYRQRPHQSLAVAVFWNQSYTEASHFRHRHSGNIIAGQSYLAAGWCNRAGHHAGQFLLSVAGNADHAVYFAAANL